MKAYKLICPFTWEERKVTIKDKVWYIPARCDHSSFSFPGWQTPELFLNQNPLKIEYCSGNGAWITNRAINDPNTNWVAVEMDFDRVRKIWGNIKRNDLNNLVTVCGEGYNFTRQFLVDQSVGEVYLNFPDPWPKRRHAKFRIVQPAFAEEILRILLPDGTFTLVTDDQDYSTIMINVMLKCTGFESVFPAPYYTHDWPGYGSSFFEELWREKGKKIYYHQFRKRSF